MREKGERARFYVNGKKGREAFDPNGIIFFDVVKNEFILQNIFFNVDKNKLILCKSYYSGSYFLKKEVVILSTAFYNFFHQNSSSS